MSHRIMPKEDESLIVTHRLSAKKSSYSMLIKEYLDLFRYTPATNANIRNRNIIPPPLVKTKKFGSNLFKKVGRKRQCLTKCSQMHYYYFVIVFST